MGDFCRSLLETSKGWPSNACFNSTWQWQRSCSGCSICSTLAVDEVQQKLMEESGYAIEEQTLQHAKLSAGAILHLEWTITNGATLCHTVWLVLKHCALTWYADGTLPHLDSEMELDHVLTEGPEARLTNSGESQRVRIFCANPVHSDSRRYTCTCLLTTKGLWS